MIKTKNIWKFRLEESYEYILPEKYVDKIQREITLIDEKGFECGVLYPKTETKKSHIIINAGYAWNGCDFKVQISKWIIGVPDFKGTYFASLIHDLMCQFKYSIPFSLEEIDLIFYDIMKSNGFWLSLLYFKSVRAYHLMF